MDGRFILMIDWGISLMILIGMKIGLARNCCSERWWSFTCICGNTCRETHGMGDWRMKGVCLYVIGDDLI